MLLASMVAEINRGAQNFWDAPLAQLQSCVVAALRS